MLMPSSYLTVEKLVGDEVRSGVAVLPAEIEVPAEKEEERRFSSGASGAADSKLGAGSGAGERKSGEN